MSNILKIAASGVEAAPTGYQISRSLRFNSADSAYLSRTPASASNRKTWTWSGWIKRANLTTTQSLLAQQSSGGNYFSFFFDASGFLQFDGNWAGTRHSRKTVALFRDPSAWYHVVLKVDTTQATAANRLLVYVNNVNYPFDTVVLGSWPTQNSDGSINLNALHEIGRRPVDNDQLLNGYLTEVHLVDGQALTPSSFGETDATTGVWKPKAYAGTYGTNGFYLDFSDNSGVTAATLGADSSGNGNNWTPNNFSVTAGAGNDSLVDTPTPYGTDTGAGGEVRGNYCTGNWNNSSATDIFTNGALDWGCDNTRVATATFGMSSGKWYCEGTVSAITSTLEIGIVGAQRSFANIFTAPGSFADGYTYLSGGNKYNNNSSTAYGASYTTNDVIGIAFDADAGTITFYKNGASQGTAFSSITAGTYVICARGTGIGPADFLMNFGQRPFAYTAPSGFKALCTQNLPTPTVVDGSSYFNTLTYTGDGTSRSLTGVGFQPDFVWLKRRSATSSHLLYNAVVGTGPNKALQSDNTNAEGGAFMDNATYGYLSSYDADGFSVVPGSSPTYTNTSGSTYVAWNWYAGGSNATNTDGTITSTVRANPTAGFSIVSWTAPSTNQSYSVGHGLGIKPAMVISKSRSYASGSSWWTWHTSLGDNTSDYVALNSTNGEGSITNMWGTVGRTDSVIGFNAPASTVTSETYIAYCFAEVEGFSKFGSYTGNGIDNGPFVFCGFRPAFVMVKRFNASGHSWGLVDMTRDTYNVCTKILQPNAPDKDYELETPLDALSNGFKVRDAPNSWNASGGTYIFVAFAENPFKYSLAR